MRIPQACSHTPFTNILYLRVHVDHDYTYVHGFVTNYAWSNLLLRASAVCICRGDDSGGCVWLLHRVFHLLHFSRHGNPWGNMFWLWCQVLVDRQGSAQRIRSECDARRHANGWGYRDWHQLATFCLLHLIVSIYPLAEFSIQNSTQGEILTAKYPNDITLRFPCSAFPRCTLHQFPRQFVKCSNGSFGKIVLKL